MSPFRKKAQFPPRQIIVLRRVIHCRGIMSPGARRSRRMTPAERTLRGFPFLNLSPASSPDGVS